MLGMWFHKWDRVKDRRWGGAAIAVRQHKCAKYGTAYHAYLPRLESKGDHPQHQLLDGAKGLEALQRLHHQRIRELCLGLGRLMSEAAIRRTNGKDRA